MYTVYGFKDPSYVAFHDEEWGVPVHDDKYVWHILSASNYFQYKYFYPSKVLVSNF